MADFKIKNIPRSLVRVPGSGRSQDAALPAISCDLGRVSALAATVSINPYLPTILKRTKLPVPSSTNNLSQNKLASSQVMTNIPGIAAAPSPKRPMNSGTEPMLSQNMKRLRPAIHTTSMAATSNKTVQGNVPCTSEPVVVPAGTLSTEGQVKPNIAATRRVMVAKRTQPHPSPSSCYSSKSIEELLEIQRKIREENRMLKQLLEYYRRRMPQENTMYLHGA